MVVCWLVIIVDAEIKEKGACSICMNVNQVIVFIMEFNKFNVEVIEFGAEVIPFL